MNQESRMNNLRSLSANINKSNCGKCGSPNNCAMEKGKSVTLCWCFSVKDVTTQEIGETCYCKSCLET